MYHPAWVTYENEEKKLFEHNKMLNDFCNKNKEEFM